MTTLGKLVKKRLSSTQIWVIETLNKHNGAVGYLPGRKPFLIPATDEEYILFNPKSIQSMVNMNLLTLRKKGKSEYRKRGFLIYELNPNFETLKEIV